MKIVKNYGKIAMGNYSYDFLIFKEGKAMFLERICEGGYKTLTFVENQFAGETLIVKIMHDMSRRAC